MRLCTSLEQEPAAAGDLKGESLPTDISCPRRFLVIPNLIWRPLLNQGALPVLRKQWTWRWRGLGERKAGPCWNGIQPHISKAYRQDLRLRNRASERR